MASLFTKIINSELPCYKIYEDEYVFSFLDINPITKGHLLIVPKLEVDQFDELPEDIYLHLHKVAKTISLHLKNKIKCKRVGQIIEGFQVPHAHLHLVPLNSEGEIISRKIKYSKEEFIEVMNLIKLC